MPELSEEYDRERELKRVGMPRIYQMPKLSDTNQAKNLVIKHPDFEIYDLFFKAPDSDKIIGTAIYTMINPGWNKQAKPWGVERDPDRKVAKDFYYNIIKGKGVVMIGTLSQGIESGQTFMIQEGIKHNIANALDEQELVFTIYYPGYYDIRDNYYPVQSKVKREQQDKKEIITGQPVQQKPATPTSFH